MKTDPGSKRASHFPRKVSKMRNNTIQLQIMIITFAAFRTASVMVVLWLGVDVVIRGFSAGTNIPISIAENIWIPQTIQQ